MRGRERRRVGVVGRAIFREESGLAVARVVRVREAKIDEKRITVLRGLAILEISEHLFAVPCATGLIGPAAFGGVLANGEELVSGLVTVAQFAGAHGVVASAILPGLPTGALIVLSAALFFGVSLLVGKKRGLIIRHLLEREAARRLRREHVLRAIFECAEEGNQVVTLDQMLAKRPWKKQELASEISLLTDEGLLTTDPSGANFQLNGRGDSEARRLVRNHRLWEIYLLNHADVAPARVDRDADLIEHVLDQRLVDELEDLLDEKARERLVPGNPEKNLP